jgi:DNA-binding transcriptional regulator LsrR (DeoR family)
MPRTEELRLLAKVASLYYEHNLRQTQIAERLSLSQAGVSRLLKRAVDEGIVRITISTPIGSHPDLERAIEAKYNLKAAIVVDHHPDPDQLLRNLGAAGAYYLETTIKDGEYIGVSSWSETLLAVAKAMQPLNQSVRAHVVQILGGVGSPNAEIHALQLTRILATLVNGAVTPLSVPGIVSSRETRDVLLSDSYTSEAVALFDKVTLALVGIGSIEPSHLLRSSGNVFSEEELVQLREAGAIGDICLHFFDADGNPVHTPLEDRVIGMSLEQLRDVNRTVAVAGGERKVAAIRGALLGGWVHVLITDQLVARRLLAA